jgi:hypothetical protein
MLDVFTGALGGMEPLAIAGGGFLMKYMAEKRAEEAENFKMAIQGLSASTEAANAAAGRGGAWMRRFIVIAVFTTLFGGCFIFGWFPHIDTVYAYMTPVKERVFGLWQGGGKMQTLSTPGFLMTPEMWRMAINICFFYFGAGVAKTRK